MYQVTYKNGLVTRAEFSNCTMEDFGIEFSDRTSFVTLTEKPRLTDIELLSTEEFHNKSKAVYRVHTAEGKFNLFIESKQIQQNKLELSAELEALKDCYIQDFVIRMKFPKKYVKTALINGSICEHTNSEIYYQHETDHAQLKLKQGQIDIARVEETLCEDAEAHLYVRDLKDHWIVHSRFFPKKDCETVWFRWINRWFWLSFTPDFSKKIQSNKFLHKFFWFRKERRGRSGLHIQLIGMLPLKKGQKISQIIRLKVTNE